MSPLHYIIFHPDYAREQLKVQADAIINGHKENWKGTIWIDEQKGNEDPYIFHSNWLYSYCHATQIKRNSDEYNSFVTENSCLFFCSGDAIDKDYLQFDTVFIVGKVTKWFNDYVTIPVEFESHNKNNKSELWRRHFRFPSLGIHKGKYTYVSKNWNGVDELYSYLPLTKEKARVIFPIEELPNKLEIKIKEKRFGKRPVPLDEEENNKILELLNKYSVTKVISNIVKQNTV